MVLFHTKSISNYYSFFNNAAILKRRFLFHILSILLVIKRNSTRYAINEWQTRVSSNKVHVFFSMLNLSTTLKTIVMAYDSSIVFHLNRI